MKYLYFLILIGFCYIMNAQGPTSVTTFEANYRDTPEQNNVYTDGGDTYSFSQGTENDLLLDAIKIDDGTGSGTFNVAVEKLADRIEIRRVDNAGTTGKRHITFFERASTYGGTTKDIKGNLFTTMEESLLSTIVGSGSDNIFANQAGITNTNNIERIDYIFEDGIVVPSDPNEGGFPILERGGNDKFVFAPITDLDMSDDPSEYKDVFEYTESDWESTGISIETAVLSGFTEATPPENLTETTATTGSQDISVIFISFADMGFTGGETVYGYSLAGNDTTIDPVDFVDFTNFPTDTPGGSSAGGVDLMAGGALTKKSFIHTPGGWFDGNNPNGTTPGCDDRIIVSGGNASINNDMTIGTLSANDGGLDLGTKTLDVCDDMETINSFSVTGGNLKFSGTSAQNIRNVNTNTLTIDNLELDNSGGLNVNANVDIKDVLKVTNGSLEVNEKVTFLCGFDTDVNGDDIKTDTAQIDEVLGSVTGNDNFVTEQCYPGRRAFRMVSPSATTTNSTLSTIRQNWQEGASAWDDDPNPGYGTHITGVAPGSGNAVGQQNLDKTDGFDWQPSGNASMFELDVANQQFTKIANTDNTTLEAGNPYLLMIRGSRAVDLKNNQSPTSNTILRERGDIVVGNKDFTFTGLNDGDFILIGNPYQSLVDINALINNSTGIKTNEVVVWDPLLGGASDVNTTSDPNNIGGRGAYVTFNPNDLPNTLSNSSSEMNGFLQVMQSVFLIKDGNGNATISFKESEKSVNETQPQVFNQNTNLSVNLLLYDEYSYDQNSTARDGLRINFVPGGNNNFDDNDLTKYFNVDEDIARVDLNTNEYTSVEQRNELMPNETLSLPIYTNKYRVSDYKFVAHIDNLPANTLVHLVDHYTDNNHSLVSGENVVSFSVDPNVPNSVASDRFEIKFDKTTLGTDDFDQAGITMYPNPVQDKVSVNLSQFNEEAKQLSVYDVTGKLINNYTIDNQDNYEINMSNYASGLYIVKIETASGQWQHKLIKE
mgnify:CR=1 FL=1